MQIIHQPANKDTHRILTPSPDFMLTLPSLPGCFFPSVIVDASVTIESASATFGETSVLNVPAYNAKKLEEERITSGLLDALGIDAEIYDFDVLSTPTDALWRPGLLVKAGQQLIHNGYWWLVKKDHLTALGNEPGVNSNTWNKLGAAPAIEPPTPPTGTYPAWDSKVKNNIGDKVTHNGANWESLVNNNTSEPKDGEAKWKKL